MPNISNTMAAGLLHANISDHNGIFCIDNNTLLSKKDVLIPKKFLAKDNMFLNYSVDVLLTDLRCQNSG